MARVIIPIQEQLSHEVIKLTKTAADAAGMYFKNNGAVKLIIHGGATTAATVTIKSRADGNRRTGDIVLTIGANEVWESSFFPNSLFSVGGSVEIDVSSTTTLSFSAVLQNS